MEYLQNTPDLGFSPKAFIDVTRNQKLAILNFLSVIAACDAKKTVSPDELAFINLYYKEFGVTGDQYLAYISTGGTDRSIAEMKYLNRNCIRYVLYATTALCECDGDMNDIELNALSFWLDAIGLNIEVWFTLLENPAAY
jgi:hypothetical protein